MKVPLDETHHLSFDDVETSVQAGNFPVIDTVAYDNIASGAALVTITHYDGNANCTTVWRGEMRRTAA